MGDLVPRTIGSAVDTARLLLYAGVILGLVSLAPAWAAVRNWRVSRQMARRADGPR